eukprot:5070402-Amphidinium_carterae.2
MQQSVMINNLRDCSCFPSGVQALMHRVFHYHFKLSPFSLNDEVIAVPLTTQKDKLSDVSNSKAQNGYQCIMMLEFVKQDKLQGKISALERHAPGV